MKEFVGYCTVCRKEIYCQNGFLEGVIQDDQSLQCFNCHHQSEEEEDHECLRRDFK